jgi:uncharacterized protein YndB with AHSA1/START domain
MSAEVDLVISRRLEAPRDRVWQALTDCEYLRGWWGPSGYRVTSCHVDLRIGGRFLVCVRSPDHRDIWSVAVYQEILPGRRLVATESYADEWGRVVSPARYGFGPDFPERDEGTELTVRHRGIPLGEDYGSARIGWSQSLRKLAVLLEPVPAGHAR